MSCVESFNVFNALITILEWPPKCFDIHPRTLHLHRLLITVTCRPCIQVGNFSSNSQQQLMFLIDLDNMAVAHASYHPLAHQQQMLMPSPHLVSPDMRYRRRSSNSPQSIIEVPMLRDRTPIRHQRPDTSRHRSHGNVRDDMLLAYTTEQSQLSHSHSTPSMSGPQGLMSSNISQVYNIPQFGASPSLAPFHGHGGYFSNQVVQPSTHDNIDFTMAHTDSEAQPYYMVGKAPSTGSAMSLSAPDSPNSLYISGQSAQGQQTISTIPGMALQGYSNLPLTLESSPADIELMPSRPKPQCWDHGCNGRQFSTFSNLLRHQREKSGSAIKATCPHCGTEFTRTTARNGHMSGGKCKGKADAEASNVG